MMGTGSSSETSVNAYQTTRHNNPGDSLFILATVRTSNLISKLDLNLM
jgi:hypothetical protein